MQTCLSNCRAVCDVCFASETPWVAPFLRRCSLGSVGIHCTQGASAVVAPAAAPTLTHFFSFPLGQVNKNEQEKAQEKCSLEKELAKYKVFHLLFHLLRYHCHLYQFILMTRWAIWLHTKAWGLEKPGSCCGSKHSVLQLVERAHCGRLVFPRESSPPPPHPVHWAA